MTKRIGILTSGGDCAGLNATIRAVALRAHHGYGWTTVGIRYGTLSLLERPVEALTLDPDRLDAALARQGGTFLGSTNRGDPFAFPMEDRSLKDRSREMVEGLESLRLDGLIGVGGDGSLDILRRLMARSTIAFIGIPKTIDNDVAIPSAPSAIRRPSPSPPRRSTACIRPAPATSGSWCSRSWAATRATSPSPRASPAAPTSC
jgi:6-phosphofructokinase 1